MRFVNSHKEYREVLHTGKVNIESSKFKGAFYMDSLDLYYHVWLSNGTLLNRFLKQSVNLDIRGLVFPRNHGFYEIFNKKLQQYFESGLIGRYVSSTKAFLNPKRYAHLFAASPQVLTMEHLQAGFVIWLVSILVSLTAFTLEWLVRLKDYLLIKHLLTAFYEQRHLDIVFKLSKVPQLNKEPKSAMMNRNVSDEAESNRDTVSREK